jgi:hypothetical protein
MASFLKARDIIWLYGRKQTLVHSAAKGYVLANISVKKQEQKTVLQRREKLSKSFFAAFRTH